MLRIRGLAFVCAAVTLTSVASAASPSLPRWGAPILVGQLPAVGTATELKTVDVNGDGLRDVIVVQLLWPTYDTFPLTILLNKGGGRFVDATSTLFEGPGVRTQWPRAIVVADFNGDRRPDIFIVDTGTDIAPYHGHQNELALSTPSGKLVDATANLPQQKSFTHSAAAADVDGNGTVDLFLGNFPCCGDDRTPPQVLLNDGTGRFAAATDRLHDVPLDRWGNFFHTASAFADVNRDGSPDLVLGAGDNVARSVVALNDGRGNFSAQSQALPDGVYGPGKGIVLDIAPIDLNGDGAVDLLFAETPVDPYYVGTRIQVLINDGGGKFRDETAARFPDQPSGRGWPNRLLVEDVNNDGAADLAVQYAPPGISPEIESTPFWLNDGHGVFHAIRGPISPAEAPLRGPAGFVDGAGAHAVFFLEGDPSGVARRYWVAPQLVAPAAPAGVRATRTLASGIRVSWQAVQGAARYEVWRSASRGGFRSRVGVTTAISFLDRTARRGAIYYYAVRAVNPGGKSGFSAPVLGRRR